jgi:hypothetical protein
MQTTTGSTIGRTWNCSDRTKPTELLENRQEAHIQTRDVAFTQSRRQKQLDAR